MITLLAFLFVLGVLIFVHELGHFLAARRHGVRVLTFSLGFGPKVLKVKRGDTEYCISAVPLGGYVKMAGENPEDPRSGQPDEFLSKTKWQRFQILFAGPAMNIILAVVVTTFVLAYQGVQVAVYWDEPAVIGSVVPGSSAEKAGLRRGDRIVNVAGDTVDTWKDLDIAVGIRRPDRDITVSVIRDSQTVTSMVRPVAEGKYEISDIGVLPDVNPIITQVIPGDRAEQAGLKAGDIVLAVNGERMATRAQLIDVISKSGGKTVQLTVRRGSEEVTVTGTPEQRGARGMMGFYISEPTKSFTPGPFEAVKLSVEHNIESSGVIFRTLAGLFTGETSGTAAARPGRHRAALGRIRAGRLHHAALADGDAEHQSRHPQPDAGAGAGRGSHPHHGARGHRPPRLQHASEREDAAGGVRRADDADGHRDL